MISEHCLPAYRRVTVIVTSRLPSQRLKARCLLGSRFDELYYRMVSSVLFLAQTYQCPFTVLFAPSGPPRCTTAPAQSHLCLSAPAIDSCFSDLSPGLRRRVEPSSGPIQEKRSVRCKAPVDRRPGCMWRRGAPRALPSSPSPPAKRRHEDAEVCTCLF